MCVSVVKLFFLCVLVVSVVVWLRVVPIVLVLVLGVIRTRTREVSCRLSATQWLPRDLQWVPSAVLLGLVVGLICVVLSLTHLSLIRLLEWKWLLPSVN